MKVAFFFRRFIEEFIWKKKKGILFFPISFFLYLLSIFLAFGTYLRNFLYDQNIFHSKKAKLPVVSIGNILVGGSGKTPLVALFLEELKDQKIALLSRGYQVFSKSKKTFVDDWRILGDEMTMIYKKFPKLLIKVGKKRDQIAFALTKKEADLIFLDDGFQHRCLKKDLECIILTGEEFSKTFLPHGPLRDFCSSLKRADLIFVNNPSLESSDLIKKNIARFSKAPTIFVKPKIVGIFEGLKKTSTRPSKFYLFSSIGNPQRLLNFLENEKISISGYQFFPDHYPCSQKDLKDLLEKANALDSVLLCTEKDFVKIPTSFLNKNSIYYFGMKLEIMEGKGIFDNFIARIKEMV